MPFNLVPKEPKIFTNTGFKIHLFLLFFFFDAKKTRKRSFYNIYFFFQPKKTQTRTNANARFCYFLKEFSVKTCWCVVCGFTSSQCFEKKRLNEFCESRVSEITSITLNKRAVPSFHPESMR